MAKPARQRETLHRRAMNPGLVKPAVYESGPKTLFGCCGSRLGLP